MTASIKPLSKRTAWKNLAAHYKKIKEVPLSKLFADDPKRGQRLTTEAAGLFLDYSKNRVTDETVKLLVQLAAESDLRGRIGAMFSGEKINITEKRAAARMLRAPKNASILVDGGNVFPRCIQFLMRWHCANRVPARVEGPRIQHRQYRHRRLGFGAGNGVWLRHYGERATPVRFNVDGIDFVEATHDLNQQDPFHRLSRRSQHSKR